MQNWNNVYKIEYIVGGTEEFLKEYDFTMLEVGFVPAVSDVRKFIAPLHAIVKAQGKINREAKNSVFLDMFGRKEYLLKMFKSVIPDDTDITEDDIEVVTIDNVLSITPYNDMGAMINRKSGKLLIMAEAQSMWSVNVIFRLWEYVVDTLMDYFINNGHDLYGTPKLPMPDVETFIIYTGKSIPKIISSGELDIDERGRLILSLNREFFGGVKGKPELTAKILYAHNSEGIIEEYIRFSQIFDEQRSKYKNEPGKALQEIFKCCESEKVLWEYLSNHRSEVEKIMMTMVSSEYVEKAAQKTQRIRDVIETCRMLKQSDEFIKDYLVEKFDISPEYAQNCIDADWE